MTVIFACARFKSYGREVTCWLAWVLLVIGLTSLAVMTSSADWVNSRATVEAQGSTVPIGPPLARPTPTSLPVDSATWTPGTLKTNAFSVTPTFDPPGATDDANHPKPGLDYGATVAEGNGADATKPWLRGETVVVAMGSLTVVGVILFFVVVARRQRG